MSGPYRFQPDSARSPLDRPPPNLFPAGNPPSFKTNVNRMKTKKWVEAKKNAYDGDDWGEYDEFDEYGAEAAAAPTGFRQPGQSLDQPYRSFTDPQQPGPPRPARRNSFEAGEEHRAFSATYPHPGHSDPHAPQQQHHAHEGYGEPQQQGNRKPSVAASEASDTPQHRRDFSPSALPPPLVTRLSSEGITGSGYGQTDSQQNMPENTSHSHEKPLPFIRPADIYRRAEDERNIDTRSPRSSEMNVPNTLQQDASKGPPASEQSAIPHIPGLDSEFWSSGPQLDTLASQPQTTSPPGETGFRDVVDQAFTRTDDQRSIPPTPISKQSDSDVSRSNTASTSGISPIMSRVPSSATSVLKHRNNTGADLSTPVIAEERSESPVSRPTSMTPRKQSPAHSRNISSSSVHRAGLTSPSPGDSPARSPAIEPQKDVPQGQSAVLTSSSPVSPVTMVGGASSPSATYATREADIASAMRMSPDKAAPALAAAEKDSQTAFLESHQMAHSPIQDTASRSRSQSPSKGRVQELAGRFGDVANSRRGSTQSSIQSWEHSRENSRPSSPTKPEQSGERPPAAREVSFRPKLPGQWESYATTVPTPSEQGDKEEGAGPEASRTTSPLGEVDLTPTTAKHPVVVNEPFKPKPDPLEHPLENPLETLKAAGTAMAEAIQASVGLTGPAAESFRGADEEWQKHPVGDVYLSRPLYIERTASSVTSSVPPTPPAKDMPYSEEVPPPPPLKEKSMEPSPSSSRQQTPSRPTMVPQLSTDPSEHDEESDRLRKEIVASLSPLRLTQSPEDNHLSALQPSVPTGANRESSILPSEYDSYWADRDHTSPTSPQLPHDQGEDVAHHATTNVAQSPGSESAKPDPALLTRFSWEGPSSVAVSSEDQAQAGAAAETTVGSQQDSTTPATASQQGPVELPVQPTVEVSEPYFGPPHEAANIESNSVTARSPVSPHDSKERLVSPLEPKTLREDSSSGLHVSPLSGSHASPSSGLHVVNSRLDPEAVDMPPRLSIEASKTDDPPQYNQAESLVSGHKQSEHQNPSVTATQPAPNHNTLPSVAPEPTAKSPTTDKPLGFRDIANIKSSSERIASYNSTRDHWANVDHGLSDWVGSALATNPDLASQSLPYQQPLTGNAATVRHRPTGSISLFGKNKAASGNEAHKVQNEQYNAAAGQVPASAAPPGGGLERTPSSNFGGAGRSASLQMQAKGKDLLHTAGVLGGKGMTGAKGLFAKGKSRFRGSGDKDAQSDSAVSSRDASEEPELVMAPDHNASMSTDIDSPKAEKKKRRLSSPFHRSSRSRSRPSSIVLPWNTPLSYGTDSAKSTPPRETPPPIGINRPYTYHAPGDWNITSDPRDQAKHRIPSTGALRPLDRLGVLPSPAKSAFSFLTHDKDDVPPVPSMPEALKNSETSGAGQGLIQSIVRYSTPPVTEKETRQLQESPVFRNSTAEHDTDATEHGMSDNLEGQQLPAYDDKPAELDHNAMPQTLTCDNVDMPETATAKPMGNDLTANMSATAVAAEVSEDSPQTSRTTTVLIVTPSAYDGGEPRAINEASPNTSAVAEGTDSNAQGDAQPDFETMIIGAGDVSPISSQAHHDDETHAEPEPTDGKGPQSTSVLESVHPSQSKTNVVSEETRPSEITTPLPRERLAAPRVSLTPSSSYVVHAVEYVPSHSSFESWEQDSVAALSQSEGSQLGDDRHDFDQNIPPVPQIPPANLTQPERVEQGLALRQRVGVFTVQEGALPEHTPPMSPGQESEQPSSAATLVPSTTLKHSHSLLSAISSAVSVDGRNTPVSPTSSHGGRSAASGKGHLLQESSPKISPVVPAVTGASHQRQRSPVTPPNGDYDLYADADGVVVVDGRQVQIPGTAVAQQSISPQQAALTPVKAQEPAQSVEDPTRYSWERPMSFVSGPRDASGRPQDQINRATPEAEIPPVPQIPHQHHQVGSGQNHQAHGPTRGGNERHDLSAPPNRVEAQYGGAAPYRNVSPLPPNNVSPPTQPTAPTSFAQMSFLQGGERAQAGVLRDPRMGSPTRPGLRNIDPRSMDRGQPYDREPLVQKQASGQMSHPAFVPKDQMHPAGDQYGTQHQLRMQQAVDPRSRGMENHLAGHGARRSDVVPVKAEEKTSSRVKLSSVFKGFGSKNGTNNPPADSLHDVQSNAALVAPANASGSASYQSDVGNLPPQPDLSKKSTRSSGFGASGTRPESMGRESHISHVSQESTKVQAADSRLDLRYPSSPAPFKGIPPQQPPPGPPVMSGALQSQRNSMPAVADSGKKKRFSALGALFKSKPSKEERKNQKTQKQLPAVPIGQTFPTNHVQRGATQQQQQGKRYEPFLIPPPPGVQGAPHQVTSSEAKPSVRQSLPSRPGQYIPSQGYPQHQHRVEEHRFTPDGSAYMVTKEAFQAQQLERARAQAFQSASQSVQPAVQNQVPPPAQGHGARRQQPLSGEYSKPDNPPMIGNGVATAGLPQQPPQHALPQIASAHQASHGRHVSSPVLTGNAHTVTPVSQRHVSSPPAEPQYETPQIPAAYRHVSGPYVSPGAQPPIIDSQASPPPSVPNFTTFQRQYSDPRVHPTSPPISVNSQMPTQRTHSESSGVSMISPVSNFSPVSPAIQSANPRMSSITEATQHEQPWHLNLPPGATEQEIIRARQQQYIEQRLAAQQQLQAERMGQSPSPHLSHNTQSPSPQPPFLAQPRAHQSQAGPLQSGFREVLPRSSPQTYQMDPEKRLPPQQDTPPIPQPGLPPVDLVPTPAAYPLPMSPDVASPGSPVNPLANALPLPPPPPPKIPHSPMQPAFAADAGPKEDVEQQSETLPPPFEDQAPPDEPPPSYSSYSGPGSAAPRESMEKERPRPPNIITNAPAIRLQRDNPRQRQASIGILQHPQPASMAASPQRSSADMGADILRRQLLEQEERGRAERAQRAEIQRAEQERERQERERARARARELERSVSGGGRVGSLRSAEGSGRAGLERSGSNATMLAPPRAVFELSAEEDDEPVMRATSFPGQEWVPTFTED